VSERRIGGLGGVLWGRLGRWGGSGCLVLFGGWCSSLGCGGRGIILR